MRASRVMPRANPTDPANQLISGATSSMAKGVFDRLERSSGLGLQGLVAANTTDMLHGLYATSWPSPPITGATR